MQHTTPTPPTLHDGLRAVADRHGDNLALRSGEDEVTYGELDALVDQAAAALAANGVGRGDRVAMMLGNRVSFVVTCYGAWRAGAAVVPINTGLTAPEIAHELTDCRATVLVVGRAWTDTVAELRGTLPDLEHVFVADSTQPVAADSGMRSWRQTRAGHAQDAPSGVEVGSSDLALLAYTSGTTGSPKAAMLTHGQLLANQRQLTASDMGVTADDVVFTALPLFHSYALNVAMGMAIQAGATLELVERFEPSSALSLVSRTRVTVIEGAPPMYVAWLNTPGADEVDLSSVRLATSGAAPLHPKVLRRCAEELSLDIREGYGLAEASPVVASSAALPEAVPGSVGRPLEGVEVRIIDDDHDAAPGDPGLIAVRGDNVFAGYWDAPEATAQVLDADGWLHTGDIGYTDDGLLYLVDRAKDVIIVSGFNVYPVEVEQALASHPDVDRAAVVGVPHPYTGEAVKAFVVRREGTEVTGEELLGHVARRVARFKQPETIEFVADLPTLPTGKVRRRLLRDL